MAFTMGIAYFVVHSSAPFGEKELSFIYLTIFSILLFTGAGKFSIDAMIGGKKK